MKKIILILIACYTLLTANAQSFNPPVKNPFNLMPTGCFSYPHFADMDNDGDFDAFDYNACTKNNIVSVSYQENTSTNTTPSFGTLQLNPFGLGEVYYYKQFMVDLDGDGDYDMVLSGGHVDPRMWWVVNWFLLYYENTGSKTSAQFTAPVTNPFGITMGGNQGGMASFVDLDDDGDMDMLTGNGVDFYYYKNTGSKTNPNFASGQPQPFGLTGAGSYSEPEFFDVDGDGDFDMMTGSYAGDFYYYENTGTKTAPAFAASALNPFGLTNLPTGNTNLTFADLDIDGDDDIMVGDNNGDHYYFENTSSIGVTESTLNAEGNLFPNPAHDFVNVALTGQYQHVIIEVISLSGQLILQDNFASSENIQLNIAELKAGIYFVKIITEHKTGLQKLVKE